MNLLIMVDVQKDFYSGSLSVFGDLRADPFARLRFLHNLSVVTVEREWDLIIATQDWHPPDHCSFENYGGKWPSHCVAGTEGSELIGPIMKYPHIIVRKGMDRTKEEYAAAWLYPVVGGVTNYGDHIYICGLATDYCVKETALMMKTSLFPYVTVLLDACAGVAEDTTLAAIEEMKAAGVTIK